MKSQKFKCAIVYYSLSGSTLLVAESIIKGLKASGYTVDLFNVRDGQLPSVKEYDLLGIGSPVYYFRLPFNVLDFLTGLPHLDGLRVFFFLLNGITFGDAIENVKNILAGKRAKEAGYFQCHGANYYLEFLKRGYLFSADHPNLDELAQAEEFGRKIGLEEEVPITIMQPLGLIYRWERFFTNRRLVRNLYSRLFLTNKDCSSCGRCVEICPTRNIRLNSEKKPVWGKDCLFCLNCERECPQDAIYFLPIKLFSPFLAYNVWRARQNNSINRVAVLHKRGKTTRI